MTTTLRRRRLAHADHPGVEAFRIAQGESAFHDHLFYELVLVERGSGAHRSAAGTHRLQPGDLVVLPPHAWHGYEETRGLEIVNCLFEPAFLQRHEALLRGVPGVLELFRRRAPRDEPPTVLHLRPAQRPAVRERLDRIMAEDAERAEGWHAVATAALLELLVTAARLSRDQLPDAGPSLSEGGERAVLDAVAEIEAHYARPLRLGELAARVHASPAYLSRCFSRRMGMPVTEFVHRLRCEEACRLLRESDEPVGRIAAEVGYEEPAYFSRMFRRYVGRSPSAYRREGSGARSGRGRVPERAQG